MSKFFAEILVLIARFVLSNIKIFIGLFIGAGCGLLLGLFLAPFVGAWIVPLQILMGALVMAPIIVKYFNDLFPPRGKQ
jgi:hypothetical protein